MDPRLARTRDGDYCPVRASLALLGQRWVPRIVYELRGGQLRFNDLAAKVGGCNSRTLRDRLRDLEEAGLVLRHEVTAAPPWVEYELTGRGHELAEALAPLASWGRRHLSLTSAPAIVE
ncbi:MAG: helix-turn-helix transcriptional regulator [Chloroflexi bacterium]|nr:helix-turn-helix transcriptional regulator [Chloroflexota bacterium]